jgi:hypothetical protein
MVEDLNDMELEVASIYDGLLERVGLPWPGDFKSLTVLCDFLSRFRLDALCVTDHAELSRRFWQVRASMFIFKSAYLDDCQRLKPLWLRNWTGEPAR